ncbi:hypothetical protein AB0D98_05400 [Streptomyces sp. NPDC047987]|uniref:hypothetical protein n=1 Tax=unclassified Streptomyces TaxID=2593676 RepID=UPI003424C66A
MDNVPRIAAFATALAAACGAAHGVGGGTDPLVTVGERPAAYTGGTLTEPRDAVGIVKGAGSYKLRKGSP